MKRARETLLIQAPEHVGFEFALAGLGTRATAFLVDTALRWLAILFVVVVVLLLVRWLPELDPLGFLGKLSTSWIVAMGVLAYGVVELGYFLLFEAIWSGQTPGKRFQRIRVMRANGEPIGWLESSIRNILRAADMLGGLYPLGFLVMFLSPRSQRIGDYAAGTVVVLERGKSLPVGAPTGPARPQVPDIEIHISTMGSSDYRLIRSFLDRRQGMDRAHREQIARTLAHRLMMQWKIPPRADLSYEDFLEAVAEVYERSRRAI